MKTLLSNISALFAPKKAVTISKPMPTVSLKVLVIGDSSNRMKTQLVMRFADNNFTPSFITTIAIDFKFATRKLDNHWVKYQVWDTPGQERFETTATAYYRGAGAVILMYDITNRESFENVKKWKKNISEHVPNVLLYLVGGCSEREAERSVSLESGRSLAAEFNIPFFECSSTTGQNVEALFAKVGRDYLSRQHQAAPAFNVRP